MNDRKVNEYSMDPILASSNCDDGTAQLIYQSSSAIFDIISESIIILDENALVAYVNNAAQLLTGKNREDILNKQFGDSFSCIGSTENERGCGHGIMCEQCEIRKAIIAAYEKDEISNDIEFIKEFIKKSVPVMYWFRATVRPASISGKKNAVIRLTDITPDKKLKDQEKLFRTIFEQAPVGILFGDKNNYILQCNPMLEKITGRPGHELKKLTWEDITHADDIRHCSDYYNKYKNGEVDGYSVIKRYIKPDDSIVWVNLTLKPLKINGRSDIKHFCMIEDITERVSAEEEMKKSYAVHKTMIENISDVISIIGKDYKVKYISPNIEKQFGWTPDEIMNTPIWNRIHPEYKARVQKIFKILFERENYVINTEFKYKCRNGTYKFVDATAKNLFRNPDIDGILLNFRDISARKNKEEKIRYLIYHDVLTGLYNRRYMEKEKKRLDAKNNMPLSVIVGDIDGMKIINDALGHQTGDKIISEMAKIIKSCTREQDLLARTGGDEFTILLPLTTYDEACAIVERIKNVYEDYKIKTKDEIYHASISLGCATKTDISDSINSIIKSAEENMYRDKILQNKSLHGSVINSMKSTLYAKSQETEEHAIRIINICRAIGEKLNLTYKQLDELELLATLHDIGKIGISDIILNKPEKLTEEEWVYMKKHSEIGYRIVKSATELEHIADYILYHHERYDGSGYPRGLRGKEIPLLSRIIAIADAYDAMTESRGYRRTLSKTEAIEEIRKNSGTQFDPEIAELFINEIADKI